MGSKPKNLGWGHGQYILIFLGLLCGTLISFTATGFEETFSSDKKSSAPKKADTDTLKLVEFFLKTPTSQLPLGAIGAFMAVDTESLPEKLRDRYRGKREELLALKTVAESKKKPPIRRLNMDPPDSKSCEPVQGPHAAMVLKLAGYTEISEDDERYLMDQTKCSECELIVEFTLKTVLAKPANKKDKPKTIYFLHGKDPLQTLVGAHHAGVKNPFGTNFFGLGHPSCH